MGKQGFYFQPKKEKRPFHQTGGIFHMEAISPRAPAKKASLCAMNRVFMVFPPITGQEAAWVTFCLIICGVVVIFVVFFFLKWSCYLLLLGNPQPFGRYQCLGVKKGWSVRHQELAFVLTQGGHTSFPTCQVSLLWQAV